jgi:hypothetical protein
MDPHDTTPLINMEESRRSWSGATAAQLINFEERRAERDWAAARRQQPQLRSRRAALLGAATLFLAAVAGVVVWREGVGSSTTRGGAPPRTAAAATREELLGETTAKARGSVENEEHQYSMSAKRDGDYQPLHEHTMNMYGLSGDLIVEPGVHNIIELGGDDLASDDVKVTWAVIKLSSENEVDPTIELPPGQTARELDVGTSLRIAVSPPNARVKVTATVRKSEWSEAAGSMKEHVVATVERTILVRYVRRELRTLPEADLERYFSAMHKVMTTPHEVGRAVYGEHFSGLSHFVALHNQNNMAYHGNLFFATSHPAMQLKFEKSLLAVDAGTPLPYWDMLQDANLGRKWTDAQVYQNNWFGPVKTTAADNFRLRGRFRDVRTIYDPDGKSFPTSWHNYFGYLGMSALDNNKSPYFQRSNNFCGFSTTVGFSDCDHIERCFLMYERTKSMHEFDLCLEHYVHANLHMQHAGQWNCAEDWHQFHRENADWLDENLLSVMAFAMNDFSRRLLTDKKLMCPMKACDILNDDHHTCKCKSAMEGIKEPADVGSMEHADVYEAVKPFWNGINAGSFDGQRYTSLLPEWGGQGPSNVTFMQASELNRLVLKTALFPGSFGKMASGAAANDPLFWVMHQIFDKAFHALRLSPRYNKEFLVWDEEGVEFGRGWNSTTPFKWHDFEPWLGENKLANSEERLTNKMLWSLLHPQTSSLPYVYDQMNTWGTCDFDPMEE